MSNNPPFLDVEDDDQRQNRIGTLLERLNTTSPSSSVTPDPLLSIGRELLSGPVEPPSELLARVQAFLPAISASNEALSQQKPEDIDIENVPEHEEQYIEMNLGLGVFEAKPHKPGSRPTSPSSETESELTSDATSSESESDSESSRSSSEEDSDYSSASANDDDSDAESQPDLPVDMKPISSRPLKPLPRAKVEV